MKLIYPSNRNWTDDQQIYSLLLYQLSYTRNGCAVWESNPGPKNGNLRCCHYTNGAKSQLNIQAIGFEPMTYRITAYRSVLLSYARMDTSAAGFEPTRVSPTDFKSVALTTRPSWHLWETTSSPPSHTIIIWHLFKLFNPLNIYFESWSPIYKNIKIEK